MAEAGTYTNVTSKALYVSGSTLTAVTETETSAVFVYWELNNRVVQPGGTIVLTAEEAATVEGTMELQG